MIMSLGNTNFNASYIRCWDREKRLSGFNHSLKSEHIQKKTLVSLHQTPFERKTHVLIHSQTRNSNQDLNS